MSAESALIRKAAPPDADMPFALIEKIRGGLRITALSRAGAALGLTPGLPLADARARVPELVAIPADPAADAALLDRLVHLAHAYSPSVSADPPHGLLLDIAGCTHRFGDGEAGLCDDLLRLLKNKALTAHAACAATPDAARALARFGGQEVRTLPVAALGLTPTIHLALQRSGLRRIGDLADLPSAPLAARFGVELPVQLARLLGDEDTHITPLAVAEPIEALRRFAEPVGRAEDVMGAMTELLGNVSGQMERRGEGGRAFVLRLQRSDGHVASLSIECGAPTRDPALVLRLLRERDRKSVV